jgi:aryl-alcohol dehydrogenase-like predicted oxidoreductase
MLDVAEEHGFRFDAVQMPVNVMDASFRSFQKHVLPRLEQKEIGVLAMKPMGGGRVVEAVLEEGSATAIDLLHYTMSQPVSVVITGIDSLKILDQALEAVRIFKPLSPRRMQELVRKTEMIARQGTSERFKTSTEHDSTAENPEWLG